MAKNDKIKNQTDESKSKKLPEVSEEDRVWFDEHLTPYASFSPILPSFLSSTTPYKSLISKLSETILLNKLPKVPGNEYAIITGQLENETLQWVSIFNNFLRLTPSFIFNNNMMNREYLSQQCEDFLFYLYKPLQKQYDVLLKDIITYNYSTFSFSCDLFKNKL